MKRRAALLLPATLPAACAGVSPGDAARLARDGEAATGRLIIDVTTAGPYVERARDLLLMRAALAAPAGTDAQALRAQPDVLAADARLAAAGRILVQGKRALEALRDSYRAFGEIAAGRTPETFDALLDRAAEDAEALRTLIERYAAHGSDIVESLPGGAAALGVARLAGGIVSQARAARRLGEPNDALIALLDGLIAAADAEAEILGSLLAQIVSDRGDDVAAALRAAGITQSRETGALEEVAEAFGWRVAPAADQRVRASPTGPIALGLRAVQSRRAGPEPARLLEPAAGRAVLVALRDQHLALRDRRSPDPALLRAGLLRLAQ